MRKKARVASISWGIIVFSLLFLTPPLAAELQVITIGTGGIGGLYYPTGSAICRMVNRSQRQSDLLCTAYSTDGSVFNLKAIRAHELDMGIVQSDWQYHAFNGSSEFRKQGPDKDLRAVFSLYDEPFTVVARTSSGIRTFDGLKGKRINIGNPGSGQRATMEVLMAAKGWTRDDFSLSTELGPAEQAEAMCDNKIDAIIFIAGHPNQSILEATTACDAVIVPVTGPAVDKLVRDNSYYIHSIIRGGMYRGNPGDVKTFGVKATLVSSSRIPEEKIYRVVKSVFDNLDEFRSLHWAFTDLVPRTMISDGNSAPLHPGAERYFRELGLLGISEAPR
jgi:TRAP transporter TAXI family solute receptor